jgi:hypothetical protein
MTLVRLESLQLDSQDCYPLPDIVMKFARNAPTLSLLRKDQFAGEVGQEFFGSLKVAHIEPGTHKAKE